MASYVIVPKTLNIKEIKNKGFALSPSLFKRVKIKNPNIKKVKELLDRELKPKDKGLEVGSNSYIYNSKHFFIRTKALQPTSFLPNYDKESIVPILPQSFKSYNLKEEDILISKDSNIGEVVILDKDLPNYMPSGGIYRLPISNLKYYLLAFMKNDFFKTQLNFLASRGATIRHAKTLFLDCSIPFPNQKNSSEVIKYVELLTKVIINKEKEIRKKHKLILEKIEKELLENQNQNIFKYNYPNIKEIEELGRLDSGLYSEDFKKLDFLIKNYKYGFSKPLKEFSFYSGNTPRKYFDANNGIVWISNKDISKNILVNIRYIVYKDNKINELIKGDILFSRRAPIGNPLIFLYDFKSFPNEGIKILRSNKYSLITKIFFALFLESKFAKFQYLVHGGAVFEGITNSQIKQIKIPNFPESKQEEIAQLYYNPIDYPSDLNIYIFLEEDNKWNKQAGILQLDLSAKRLKERLNEVIHQIVMDNEVKIAL